MNRIAKAFEKHKALITFVTAGDPNLDKTAELLIAMQEAGADLIEIGIPFSDPVAEGPVIQDANVRALSMGTTTDHIFDMLERMKDKITVPLVFMTYMNPIFTYGTERFMEKCQACGIDGVIVPDVPYEEKEELEGAAKKYGITQISMIAPTSENRIQMIASEAQGFLYCVSSLGVTGVRSKITTDIKSMIKSAKEVTNLPCAIGFGIASKEQAKEMAELSDGVIIGSAIVRIIGENPDTCVQKVGEFVSEIKTGMME